LEPSEDEVRPLIEDVGNQVRAIVVAVGNQTADEDIDSASAQLHQALQDAGVAQDEAWCRQVLQTLRRGDEVNLIIE
jgi:ribosomal protein L12E/L44/L45/RPP1/RPP2